MFGNNEYAIYDGPGCYLDGFDIGEVEEQVGISDYPEFEVLHKCGELDDCLDEYDGYACINRSKRRVKNEKTGHYEEVGRNTYDTHGSDYPTFEFYHSPGGRWDFVVPDDRMNDLLQEALIELFEKEVL